MVSAQTTATSVLACAMQASATLNALHGCARAEIKSAMQTLDKAVASKESRFMSRVIRQVTTIRRMLGKAQLLQALDLYVPSDSPSR